LYHFLNHRKFTYVVDTRLWYYFVMKFIIGSMSARKIKIAEKIIRQFFIDQKDIYIEGFGAKSQMPDTPWDKQTFDGAKNRAIDSKFNIKDGDYYIGLESGLVERYGHIYEEAWVVVITSDNKEYNGYSSGLKVPDFILKRMDELKMEHSDVMTIIEKEYGKLPNDTWGTYSGGTLLREVGLEEALRNAFIQITAPEVSFYKK
jgi:non-canonical (house-cleaning) NTP pyrophosphatase